MEDMSLMNQVGEEVLLEGIAENGKGGALLILPYGEVVYIRHLDEWEGDLRGTRISVRGIVRYEKYIPDPAISEDGGISQGALGLQYVLDDAQLNG